VLRQKSRIEEQVSRGGPEHKDHLRLLHRYNLFLLKTGRHLQDYSGADPIGLIDSAREIDDPDTLSISLYHRGKMYYEQQSYSAALVDIREALSQGKKAGPLVKGSVLVGAGPVLAHEAVDQRGVNEVLELLDEAEKCLGQAKGYPDPFHTGFDESWYYQARASSIIPLLRLDPTQIDKVFEALALAQERTRPQYRRRHASIELLYADATFHTKDYLSAASTAIEALELARSINLVHNIERIQRLYGNLTQTKMKDSSELRKLRQALAKKETL
jgi:tetratricopeptide (TPR) repeat protein